jgi:PST family polysaccharide transporter
MLDDHGRPSRPVDEHVSAQSQRTQVGAVTPPAEEQGRSPKDLADRAARGTGITLLVQAVRALVQFGMVVVLARLLTPEDFGLVAMVTAVIGLADLVRDFGLSMATMQSATLSVEERTNLFWVNLGMGTICSFVAAALTPLIVLLYDETQLTPVVLTMAGIFAVSGFTTQFKAGLARDLRFKALGMAELGAQLVSTVLAIALAAFGFGVWALVWQQVVNAVALAAISVYQAHWWPSWPHRHVSIRRFLNFGLGVFGTQVVSYATKNLDNVAIGAAYGPVSLGLYSRAYQLMRMPLAQINAPLNNIALPVLRHVQQDDRRLESYLDKAQLVLLYATVMIFAVAGGLAQPVVAVLFGDRWHDVAPIFAALAIGGVFRAVAAVSFWAYLARSMSGALFRQRTVTGTISVALIFAGLPWGPVGVAWGVTLGALIAWLVGLWHAGHVTGLDMRPLFEHALRALLLVGLPCGLAAYSATLVPVDAFVQLVLGGVFAAGYLVIPYLLVAPLRREMRMIADFAVRAVRTRGQASQKPSMNRRGSGSG